MSKLYPFTHDGIDYELNLSQIQKRFVPSRTAAWVKLGLESGARTVAELSTAAAVRQRDGALRSRVATKILNAKRGRIL